MQRLIFVLAILGLTISLRVVLGSHRSTSPRDTVLQTPSASNPPDRLIVQVEGTTSTQAILRYAVPDNKPCTLEVRENSSSSPLAHDIDPALFPSSSSDGGGALQRFWVIGKKLTNRAVDGRNYSRALQTNTLHYYQLTCGAQQAQGSFTTKNIPLGKTFSEALQVDKNNPGQYMIPTIDLSNRNQTIIDPNTGALIRRVTLPGDVSGRIGFYDTGGFDACSTNLTNGGYHCIVPWNIQQLYWINPARGEVRHLGSMVIPYNPPAWPQTIYVSPFSALWDSTDGNVYYYVSTLDGTPATISLLKGTYTGRDVRVRPDTTAAISWRNLTPHPSLSSLLKSFNAQYDPSKYGCSAASMNGDFLILRCQRYYQDSHAWMAAVNVKTVQVVAMAKTWEKLVSRWCGVHATIPVGNTPSVIGWSTQQLYGDTAAGPYVVTLGSSVSTSDTNLAVSGEPVGQDQVHADAFLLNAAVGDKFLIADATQGNEVVQITQKTSSTSWVVKRAVDYPFQAHPHARGVQLWATCQNLANYFWDYAHDPNGTDTTGTYYFQDPYLSGHRAVRSPYDVTEAWAVRVGNLPDSLKQVPTFFLDNSPLFAGAFASANGNSYAKHPSYSQVKAPPDEQGWFLDLMPFDGGGDFSSRPGVTPISGQLYKYLVAHTGDPAHTGNLDRDVYPTFGTSGDKALVDVSGPHSRLSDTAADSNKFCVAKWAGECWNNSKPNDIYVNVPNLRYNYCTGADGPNPSRIDVCIADFPMYGQALVQMGATVGNHVNKVNVNRVSVPVSDAKLNRVLTNALSKYKNMYYYANARALPDGSWALFPGSDNPMQVFMVKIPPYPAPDEVDRSNFIDVQVNVPAVPGATSVKVYYGYEENGPRTAFYCTQRVETCSVSAKPGRAIKLRGIPQRVLFYRISYLDESDHVWREGGINAAVVP